MGLGRSALLFLATVAALALGGAVPALALEPAGDGWYWQLPQPQGQMLNAVDMPDAVNAWAVGCGGVIMHSADGGATWVRQQSPVMGTLSDVAFVDALHGCAVGGLQPLESLGASPASTTALVFTTDGGATWLPAERPGDAALAAVSFADAVNGWAVGSGGTILHTADGGVHWTAQRSGITHDLWAVTFVDARHGYAAGDGDMLLETTDAGLTWARIRPAARLFWEDCTSLAVDAAGTLWAALGARNVSGDFARLDQVLGRRSPLARGGRRRYGLQRVVRGRRGRAHPGRRSCRRG